MRIPRIASVVSLVVAGSLLAIACGSDDDTPTSAPGGTSIPGPTSTAALTGPSGTLNIGYNVLGPSRFIPDQYAFPQLEIYSQTPIVETPIVTLPDGSLEGRLLESWEVSSDGTLTTFKFRQGIPFHKGFGELTVDDFVWTLERSAIEGTIFAGAGRVRGIFLADDAVMTKVDSHTLELRTAKPQIDTVRALSAPLTDTVAVFSKNQFDAVGESMAGEGVGTGPWKVEQFNSGELMRLSAVENHYRKTPAFAELVIWEIPEEATRLANFLTGKIDSMHAGLESVDTLKGVSGVEFMRLAGGGQVYVMPGGQFYGPPQSGYDPMVPWVSSDPDVNSAEWARARDVRLAMAKAIDRDSIVTNLLKGAGDAAHVHGWMGIESQMEELGQLRYKYDPEAARQLLSDAGYPSSYLAEFFIATPPFPGDEEIGEAVAAMLEAIGMRIKINKLPYATFRPNLLARSWHDISFASSGFQPEPRILFSGVYHTSSGFNRGIEHPFIDASLDEINATVDADQRWALQRKFSQWAFDNAIQIPVVKVVRIWPVGSKIDTWDLMGAPSRHLSNLEFVTPR